MPSVQLYAQLIYYRLKWAPKVVHHTQTDTLETRKKPLSFFAIISSFLYIPSHFYPIVSLRLRLPNTPHPTPCPFTLVVSSSNPSHQENRKSEKRKFPNKSLWHREHLLVYCVHSSFCERSKSHWRLQYVSSLWTFLIVCETSRRDEWSALPQENCH